QNDSTHSAGVFGYGLFAGSFGFNPKTCAEAAAITTVTNCTNADPVFVAANPAWYNAIPSFDFRLLSNSPALHTGTVAGIPSFDLAGRPFLSGTPSMGAIEQASI